MAKITRKAFIRKKMIGLAITFTAITLAAVGVLTIVLSSATHINNSASISVGMVDAEEEFFVKKETKIRVTGDETYLDAPVYRFEPAKDDNEGRVRFVDVSEVLSLTVEGTINHAQKLSSITAMVMCKDTSNNNKIKTAVEKGYIELPEALTYDKAELPIYNGSTTTTISSCFHVIENEGGLLKFGYDVAFKWGSFFRNMNPSLYFDLDDVKDEIPLGDSSSPSGSNTVIGILSELHSLLNGIELNLWLTAK